MLDLPKIEAERLAFAGRLLDGAERAAGRDRRRAGR